ncbi:MAG TPA: biopolymer transporter ExbD [Opitutales bacterium]|nr:biopolymer transporter ExbD [Opitutales bacterium]
MSAPLTDPWGLRGRMHGKAPAVEFSAWLGVVILLFGVAALSSKFIMAPGVSVVLPQAKAPLVGVATDYVLTLGAEQTFFWAGRVYSREELAKAFKAALNKAGGDPTQTPLLIKANAGADLQTFLNVCELARQSGFSNVHIAAQQAQ